MLVSWLSSAIDPALVARLGLCKDPSLSFLVVEEPVFGFFVCSKDESVFFVLFFAAVTDCLIRNGFATVFAVDFRLDVVLLVVVVFSMSTG